MVLKICVVCGKEYCTRLDDKFYGNKHLHKRPMNAKTCCKKCSREHLYSHNKEDLNINYDF
jgi:hypothetical protein